MPALKLRKTAGLKPFVPEKVLAVRKKVAGALSECLLEGDREGFLEILSAHIAAVNKAKLARDADIGRKTLYRILDKTANPRLETIMAFMRRIG